MKWILLCFVLGCIIAFSGCTVLQKTKFVVQSKQQGVDYKVEYSAEY